MASPCAAIYLCDNKRIVFLSSPLAPQRAAFEVGTDDSRSHQGSAIGYPCGNRDALKFMTDDRNTKPHEPCG